MMRRVAAVAALVVFSVLAGTGVSHAVWNATVTAGAAASSTSASVAVTTSGLAASYTSSSATGAVIGEMGLANTGGAPLTLALAATSTNPALSGAISVRFWARSAGTCGTAVPSTGVTTGTLAALPALPASSASLAAGASSVVCVATAFTGSASASAGQTTTATLTLTGAVGANWRPTASATVTQSVASATASVPAFTCTDGVGLVSISWPNTATANTGTVYRSKVNGAYPAGLADRSFYYHEFSNQGLQGTGLPSVAGSYPWLIEETTNGVTKTAYAGTVKVIFYAPYNAYVIQCG